MFMTTDFSARLKALTNEPSRDDAHDPNRLARVAKTRAEMMGQGIAIVETLAREAQVLNQVATQLRARRISRVVIVGCGDSWFIGTAVRHAWEVLAGVPVEAAQALDYACYGSVTANSDTLVIGISAGGSTGAVMAALRAGQARGAFAIGVSNTPGSAILTEFDAALVVQAARRGWPTQSSTATMALLIRLAQRWADTPLAEAVGADLDLIPATVDALAQSLDNQMKLIASEAASAGLVLFSGLGPNYAAAAFGAAKVKELSPIHALAMQLEEYHHYRAQKPDEPLLLVATDTASYERALDTALVSSARGGWTVAIVAQHLPEIESRVQHVVRVPVVRDELAAFVASVPLHLFAYHFAMARDALGMGCADTGIGN